VILGTVGVKAFVGGINTKGEGDANVANITIIKVVTTLLKTF